MRVMSGKVLEEIPGFTQELQAAWKDLNVIIVRNEDLIFRPRPLIEKICKCAGGEVNKVIQSIDAPAFPPQNSRLSAQELYEKQEHRYALYTYEDLQWMESKLDVEILRRFGYDFQWEIIDALEEGER